MKEAQEMVREFHRTFGLLVNEKPCIPNIGHIETSLDLIREEYTELMVASNRDNISIIEVADALGDLIYVTLGMAVRFGIELDPIFREIQRSNMSKVGGHINEKGKYEKPSTYSKADLRPILLSQGWKAYFD